MKWAQKSTVHYPGVCVSDFTKSWRDGLALIALVHRSRPDLIDWNFSCKCEPRQRLEIVFSIVEKECGVTKLLDPEGNLYKYINI